MGKKEKLQKLAKRIQICQKCSLYKSAIQAVPGEGDPEAKIFLIGEAPGFWEDQKGKPFVGEAGQILDKLLLSLSLSREEVFIGNILKHRPPKNRDPEFSEIEACRDWLWEQLKIIDPDLIVTLGRFALREFFPEAKISHVHGQKMVYQLNGKKKIVVPMFHPAAILWNRRIENLLEEDFTNLKPLIKKFVTIETE